MAWIFTKVGDGGDIEMPGLLRWSCALFGVALITQLCKYALSTYRWGSFYDKQEEKADLSKGDPDVEEAPDDINRLPEGLMWLEFWLVLAGWAMTISYLVRSLLG